MLVVLAIASNAARGGLRAPDATAQEAASYYQENAGALEVDLGLSVLTNIFLLPFFAGLFVVARAVSTSATTHGR